jgi:hypothetical protein
MKKEIIKFTMDEICGNSATNFVFKATISIKTTSRTWYGKKIETIEDREIFSRFGSLWAFSDNGEWIRDLDVEKSARVYFLNNPLKDKYGILV